MVTDTIAIRPCLNVWHSKTATLSKIYGRLLANPKFESVTRMTLSIPTSKIVNRTKGKQNRNMLDVTKDDAIYVVSLTILMILLLNTMRRIRLNKRLPSFLLKLEQKHSHRSL
ncbi:conserved hypothetical protein [Vibrio crassostreae]|uniref:Uncharacterized protein n=1 Tax=Vibrio crassostreae TaxID=246167 RepID=A0A822MWW1_9VIBR|nr:conserved hypothetical protein [Vibrio crassostreae]CAK1843559.1 conserved hypothetical protein [Vibrio crassostreae]CAK1882996.1 conserved hypothetical protein [Vibrio crassostreae]CAK1892810.1 conserved hypothetical protein [Vibrio crassostreae]CAK1897989.1 conserved hypothetical protein [Vibrio crassostreae]